MNTSSHWRGWAMALLCTATIPISSARADMIVVDAASATITGSPRSFTLHLVDDDHQHRVELDFGALGKIGVTSFDDDAVTLPVFTGAKGFSARVYFDGVLQTSVDASTTPLLLKGFGGSGSGALDAMKVELGFGIERKDRFGVRITHGRRSVVLMPDGVPMPLSSGLDQITVRTTGVDHFLIER